MGVNKLHDQLRPHYNQVDALVDYKGLCVGVDALCWVHRAAKHAISSGDHDVDTLCARVSKFDPCLPQRARLWLPSLGKS